VLFAIEGAKVCYNIGKTMYSDGERRENFMRIIKVTSQDAKGMKAMKRSARQKKHFALNNAKASLAIEGMQLTPKEEELLLLRADGKMKNSEFLSRALEIAKNV